MKPFEKYEEFVSRIIYIRRWASILLFALPSLIILVSFLLLLQLTPIFQNDLYFADIFFISLTTTLIHGTSVLLLSSRFRVIHEFDHFRTGISFVWASGFLLCAIFVNFVWSSIFHQNVTE